MMTSRLPLLACLLTLAFTPALHADTGTFALIGDTPYTDRERQLLPQLLDEIGTAGAEFVMHIGDIKNGHTVCSDEVFLDRRQVFAASPAPFVYVLGDNEWTDCHRTNNGGYDSVERLQRLRTLFFAEPRSLGVKKIALERQSADYPEHVRWQSGPVLFVGLNVPGSDNNWGSKPTPSAEYRQRMPQVVAWLKDGFARARQQKLGAIVLGIQANPDFELFNKGTPNGAYREFIEALRAETQAFPGEVVLVHGDTHMHHIDHPLRHSESHEVLGNFTRIETYGSPFMGWVRGTINPQGQPVLRFESRPFPAQTPTVTP